MICMMTKSYAVLFCSRCWRGSPNHHCCIIWSILVYLIWHFLTVTSSGVAIFSILWLVEGKANRLCEGKKKDWPRDGLHFSTFFVLFWKILLISIEPYFRTQMRSMEGYIQCLRKPHPQSMKSRNKARIYSMSQTSGILDQQNSIIQQLVTYLIFA